MQELECWWLLQTDGPPEVSGNQVGPNYGLNSKWWWYHKERTQWSQNLCVGRSRVWILLSALDFLLRISIEYPYLFHLDSILMCARLNNWSQSPVVQVSIVPVVEQRWPRGQHIFLFSRSVYNSIKQNCQHFMLPEIQQKIVQLTQMSLLPRG